MIRAICDFCGNECGLNGKFLKLDNTSHINDMDTGTQYTSGFVICNECRQEKQMSNVYKMETIEIDS